jgi:DNA repair protein RadC
MHGLGKAEFDAAGRPIRMNGTAQDITERKHTEQALRESEHLYRELVELAPDLIWVHCGGTITYINPAGARLLGAESPYAIIGRSARDFIHPDCWDAVRSRVKRVTVDRLPQPPMEMKFIRLDGEVIEVDSFGTPFTHEGTAAVRGVVRDITERKRAQELLSEPKGRRKDLQKELVKVGETAFSDTDMLELVLNLAQPRGNMRPLAERLIERYGSFAEVINADSERLPEVRGVSEPAIAALKIVHGAAVRLVRSRILNRPIVSSSQQLLDYIRANMSLSGREELRILFLDRKNTVIADEAHQQGTINHVSLYPREIVKRALQLNASALIIAHNHPSGDPTPSNSDVDMTRKLVEATRQLDIEVHDHIIVGKGAHVSLRNTGLI